MLGYHELAHGRAWIPVLFGAALWSFLPGAVVGGGFGRTVSRLIQTWRADEAVADIAFACGLALAVHGAAGALLGIVTGEHSAYELAVAGIGSTALLFVWAIRRGPGPSHNQS
jgi:hypothetical protein